MCLIDVSQLTAALWNIFIEINYFSDIVSNIKTWMNFKASAPLGSKSLSLNQTRETWEEENIIRYYIHSAAGLSRKLKMKLIRFSWLFKFCIWLPYVIVQFGERMQTTTNYYAVPQRVGRELGPIHTLPLFWLQVFGSLDRACFPRACSTSSTVRVIYYIILTLFSSCIRQTRPNHPRVPFLILLITHYLQSKKDIICKTSKLSPAMTKYDKDFYDTALEWSILCL